MSFFKDLKGKLKKDKPVEGEVIAAPSKAVQDGFLQGNFLVSTTQIQEKIFARSVVLITSHNETGAMGLIINKELKSASLEEVLKGLDIETEIKDGVKLPVHFGGPVEKTRGFVVHSDDYKIQNTVTYPNGIAISSEKQAMEDYINGKGAENMCLVLGYAGWVAGQLEQELESGAWISVPASRELIFDAANDSKWQKAADSQGIDIFKLSPFIGNA